MDILIGGLLLGALYALLAMGLTLQYGVARIMNLAAGEMLVLGAFAAFWTVTARHLPPWVCLLVVVPLAFALNWLIYRVLLVPLVRRDQGRGSLDADSILATFGLSFMLVGLMRSTFGGNYFSYSYAATPIDLGGHVVALNRLGAASAAVALAAALIVLLHRTRIGLALRAMATRPESAPLVGIDRQRLSATAFAVGGAISAAAGVLLSMFLTLDASTGALFTMKALIIVIMGGVGDVRGAALAALLLGLAETAIARWIDPGLTLAAAYLLFMAVLLWRPQGLLGRRAG